MPIKNATTTEITVKLALCPYQNCEGYRTYYVHPATGYPTPVDSSDAKADLKRARFAVGGSREDEDPYDVTIDREKTRINVGRDDERYEISDSFSIASETFEPNELVGSIAYLDFPDANMGNKRKTRCKVLSNTAKKITLSKPLPINFESTLSDVKVSILAKPSSRSGKIGKGKVKKTLWENYMFVCQECNKPYFVDKP